jgi:hypothetical protein
MFQWWKKKLPLFGLVLFRGTLAPRAEEFAYLEKSGITVAPLEPQPNMAWRLRLSHPQWGEAEMAHLKGLGSPPREVVEYAYLSQDEKDAALAGDSVVSLKMEPPHENILRDRKLLLRFLRAVMGADGVAAVDTLAQKIWSRDALDEELQHDADLDVDALFTVHAVTDEKNNQRPYWIHTHGLGEIGGFDFDILEPSDDLCRRGGPDTLRALAFAIVERSVEVNTPCFELASPGGDVRLLDIKSFLEHAPPRHAERLKDGADDGHLEKRAVLCEPESQGFFSRLFRPKVRPSRFLSEPAPDEIIVRFSTPASELMAERARLTYGVFRTLAAEMKEFEFPTIAKLGYQVDGGGETDREHLWFEVHECADDNMDATLANQPFNIARMKTGDRARHPLSLLSDWTILTPFGHMTPRNLLPARMVRAHREELRAAMREHREKGQP